MHLMEHFARTQASLGEQLHGLETDELVHLADELFCTSAVVHPLKLFFDEVFRLAFDLVSAEEDRRSRRTGCG